MARLQAFPPLSGANAHTLILGSMPGVASLAAGQYYAHPRNLFWPFMAELLGIDIDQPYAARIEQLSGHGFALWDVLRACRRAGSLDTRIEPGSIEINEFAPFLATHPGIRRIFFNGTAAERLFCRHVLSGLPAGADALRRTRLPSTSPANASIPYPQKLAAWRALLA